MDLRRSLQIPFRTFLFLLGSLPCSLLCTGVEHLLRDVKDSTISTLATEVRRSFPMPQSSLPLAGDHKERSEAVTALWLEEAYSHQRGSRMPSSTRLVEATYIKASFEV